MDSASEHSFKIRDSYFNSLCLEILTHGIYTAIVSVALYSLFNRSKKLYSTSTHISLALLILTMYSLATIHVSVRWYWIRQALIVKGTTASSVVAALGDTRFLWLWMTSGIVASLNIFIADCILIWRCWCVWDGRWKVVIVPIMCTIIGIIFTGFFIYQEQPHPSAQWSSWGASINWGVPYFAMSLATTLLCTSLIVFRIWYLGRVDALRTYHRIIEVIVESAALYAIALVVFLVFFVRDDLNTGYPQAVLYSITGIAPTLIVVRVASHPREHRSTLQSSSLRFGADSTRDVERQGMDLASYGTQSISEEKPIPMTRPVYLAN
ncbi:hypothetical protein BDZ89DRAFT_1133678 [Hymenopellis radicata]|nr:hypothetical protein BDZ89DRAFT_1133678 [Hymenopellis radicata]